MISVICFPEHIEKNRNVLPVTLRVTFAWQWAGEHTRKIDKYTNKNSRPIKWKFPQINYSTFCIFYMLKNPFRNLIFLKIFDYENKMIYIIKYRKLSSLKHHLSSIPSNANQLFSSHFYIFITFVLLYVCYALLKTLFLIIYK